MKTLTAVDKVGNATEREGWGGEGKMSLVLDSWRQSTFKSSTIRVDFIEWS